MDELIKDLEAVLSPYVDINYKDGVVIRKSHGLARQCAVLAKAHFNKPSDEVTK